MTKTEITKLKLETSLESKAPDWLELRLVSKLTNHMLEFRDWSPTEV
jgi:hypothetical protein